MQTKRFALLPSEREKPCPHSHVAYSGRMPNTGPLVCRMCGATFNSLAESGGRVASDDAKASVG